MVNRGEEKVRVHMNVVPRKIVFYHQLNTSHFQSKSAHAKQFTLFDHQHFPPIQLQRKILVEHGFNFQEIQKIYSLPFRVTN